MSISIVKSCSQFNHCLPLSKLRPRPQITWDKHERIRRNKEIWDNPKSIVHRLPKHYQQHYWRDFVLADRPAVHYEPPPYRFYWDEKRKVEFETEEFPILVEHCPEQDDGLWHGEGIAKGYRESRPKTSKKILPRHWVPRLYFPELRHALLYSEVLNAHMKIAVTERAWRAIERCFGLDAYLLGTRDAEINSRLGMDLKRAILVSLAKQDYYPADAERHAYIGQKYAEFVLPLEQAEWYGLELNAACRKLQDAEERAAPVPLKYAFERELVRELEQEKQANEATN